MSRFLEILKAAGSNADQAIPEAWASQFPLLRDAFFPAPGKASGTFVSPKFSVTAFSEGSRLKLVMGSKTHPRKLWLTLEGPEGLLEQLELALKNGHGEWRDAQEEN